MKIFTKKMTVQSPMGIMFSLVAFLIVFRTRGLTLNRLDVHSEYGINDIPLECEP
jgi:hypothetical protein